MPASGCREVPSECGGYTLTKVCGEFKSTGTAGAPLDTMNAFDFLVLAGTDIVCTSVVTWYVVSNYYTH